MNTFPLTYCKRNNLIQIIKVKNKTSNTSMTSEHQNGMGQVPTLVFTNDNGQTVTMTQSLAIIEYIDQVCDGIPILPTEPLALFKCRELSQIIGTGIQPVQNLSVLKKVVALTGDSDYKMKWGKDTIEAGFKVSLAKIKFLVHS